MLKAQIALIAILIASLAFVSCERAQEMLEPVADDMMATDDMMMDMMDSTMYMSWASVALPAPPAEVTNPGESGGAHGMGTRTVYINDIGAMANKDGTTYPAGTIIIKTIMDDANTFVAKKAMMMKIDDPMYAGHNGWMYKKYARADESAEYMQVKGSNLEDAANGCHGCHAKAGTEGASGHDSVFVSLALDSMMATDDMPMDMMDMGMDVTAHKSWEHLMLPAPGAQADAMSAAETGEVHGKGTRTVYINEAGIMAMKDMSMPAFPAGTIIVKEIMDDTNMFVQKIATMMKTDDPMYAGHNGWMYRKYVRADESAEYMQVKGSNLEDAANGCHGCHAKAVHDSVFVPELKLGGEDLNGDGVINLLDLGLAESMAHEDMDDGIVDDMIDDGMGADNGADAGDAQ